MTRADAFAAQVQALTAKAELHFYAIVDSAQDKQLLGAIQKMWKATQTLCLLPDAQGSEAAKVSPHLVSLPAPDNKVGIWQTLLKAGQSLPASLTLIASDLEFGALHAHLSQFTEIVLPDGTGMLFAFWDPAILGTLIGQKDDTTLHVPGPAFSARQKKKLLRGIASWWYWDRRTERHQIILAAGPDEDGEVKLPLLLGQGQVDMLVEASVPDHILAYVRENQPQLLAAIGAIEQYFVVERSLLEARKVGLQGMQDMVNYACASLIYGERMHTDTVIINLLGEVKAGRMNMNQAMEKFP